MIRSVLCIAFLCLSQLIYAQSPDFRWASSIASTNTQVGTQIITDAQENVYHIGHFSGTVDFDPSTSTFNMTAGGGVDLYIQKLDSTGNFIWAKQIGGATTLDTIMSTGKDGALLHNNGLLITGNFTGTIDFDPGTGTNNQIALANTRYLFVLKLDQTGNFSWVRTAEGYDDYSITAVHLDILSNIYLAGVYNDSIDLDLGPSFDLSYSRGDYDCFIIRLDSQANYLSGHTFGSTGKDQLTDITRDDIQGFTVVSGSFENTLDFNVGGTTTNLTSNGMSDAFVAYLTNAGLCFMSKQIGGTGNDVAMVIERDLAGAIYCGGSFQGTVDLNPNTGQDLFTTSNSEDNFVVKLDTAGTYFYGEKIEGAGKIDFKELIADNNNALLFYGTINGTVDIDPSATVNPISVTGNEVFIGKYTDQMNLLWGVNLGNNAGAVGEDFEYIGLNAMYHTGSYTSTGDFGIGANTMTLTAPSANPSAFISKLQEITISCPPIDTAVFVMNDSLTSLATGVGLSYTWIDCTTGQPIPGATGQTYVAPVNGNYAVSISDGSCSVISACHYASPVACDSVEVSFTISQNSTNLFDLALQPYLAGSLPTNNIILTWDFGDGSPQIVLLPTDSVSHNFTNFGIYNICVTVFDSTLNCTDTYCDTLGIDSTGTIFMRGAAGFDLNVGPVVFTSVNSSTDHIESNSNLKMNLYPNPTAGLLNVEFKNSAIEEYTLQIVSVNGQVLRALQLNNQLTTLDVSELPKGVYMIRMQSASEHQSQLFIKK